jgi:hypothetical protein
MNNGSRHVGFDSLKCPRCGATIPVSAAIAAHVAEEAHIVLQEERRILEDRIKSVDLEVGRRMSAERQKIEATVVRRVEHQYQLHIADKEKALQDARKVNEELTRKLQQGSQQSQGEVLERTLEVSLKNAFPTDQLAPVPKGVNGADVIHKVISRAGDVCGTIVWEFKRTKSWSTSWVQKLKDNQRSVKAELAVIVSEALPPSCRHFASLSGVWVTTLEGVWVTSPQCAVILAHALRQNLADVALLRAKMVAEGKDKKLELLHRYLTGAEFKQRVEVTVETLREMQSDLQDERRATERRWAKREKQLHRITGSTAGMYGELQGVLGSSMALIPSLEGAPDESSDASAEALASPATSASQSAELLNAQFGIFGTVGTGSTRASDDAWWYYTVNGNVGPLTLDGLLEILAASSNAKDVDVWCARFTNWMRAEEVPELKAKLERINPGRMGGGNGIFRH